MQGVLLDEIAHEEINIYSQYKVTVMETVITNTKCIQTLVPFSLITNHRKKWNAAARKCQGACITQWKCTNSKPQYFIKSTSNCLQRSCWRWQPSCTVQWKLPTKKTYPPPTQCYHLLICIPKKLDQQSNPRCISYGGLFLLQTHGKCTTGTKNDCSSPLDSLLYGLFALLYCQCF